MGDEDTTPEFDLDHVWFNGVAEASHETFYVSSKDRDFSFCKTAHKSYDICVMCCLLVFQYHFGAETFVISSDGGPDEWRPALDAMKERLGLAVEMPPEITS